MAKELDKDKLITSSLMARKHKHIYLDRKLPHNMFCSSMSPDELFAKIPTISDAVHKIELDESFDCITPWINTIPIPKYFDKFCISKKGMDRMKRLYKNDQDAIQNEYKVCEVTGCIYVIKEEKNGTKIKYVRQPLIWELTETHFSMLNEMINSTVNWVNKYGEKTEFSISSKQLSRGEATLLNLNDYCLKDIDVNIPFEDGFNSISIREFLKRIKHDDLKIVVSCYGSIIRYYCIVDNEIIKATSVVPSAMYYNRRIKQWAQE